MGRHLLGADCDEAAHTRAAQLALATVNGLRERRLRDFSERSARAKQRNDAPASGGMAKP